MKYAMIKENSKHFAVRMMCRMLCVSPSGYYEWLDGPVIEGSTPDYIEVYYNRKRRHSALGYLSPAHYEEKMVA